VDGVIISIDRSYERVEELKAIEPEDFLSNLCQSLVGVRT